MKKYNRLIVLSVMLYLLAALGIADASYRETAEREKAYKVEINRIYSSLSGGISLDKLDLRSYKYVREVSYLPLDELDHEDITLEFYGGSGSGEMEFSPLYTDGRFAGFLRFDYHRPELNQRRIILLTQFALGLMELFLLGILFYLKYQLIRPFQRMSSLTYELAQGHFKGEVKEEKSRFFGRFMLGIGQLKDTLEVTKRGSWNCSGRKSCSCYPFHMTSKPLLTPFVSAGGLWRRNYIKRRSRRGMQSVRSKQKRRRLSATLRKL